MLIEMDNVEELKGKVKDALKDLKNPVNMILFTAKKDCEYCKDAKDIAQLVAESNELISLESFDLEKDKKKADEYKIDKVPALIVHGKDKRMVRFFGMAAGYEFSTLISDIKDASLGKPDIPEDLIKKIKSIDKKLHIQVFVTPTCPYCPGAVKVAHDLALLNPKITGDMIESMEFRELAKKHEVSGVPKTVINGKTDFVGAKPLDFVLKMIEEMK
jgi:glutaredoxin-like protein